MMRRAPFIAFTAVLMEVIMERVGEPGLFHPNGSAPCSICEARRRRRHGLLRRRR